MKPDRQIKSNIHAFPYPVLINDKGNAADYQKSTFKCDLAFSSEVDDNSKFTINYTFELKNDDIARLIDNGDADFAIEINCADTRKREVQFLDQKGKLEIDASKLYSRVEFTPMIVMRKSGVPFSSDDLHEEFDRASFTLNIGDIIAIADIWTRYIEFDNVRFGSLVTAVNAEELKPFEYKIETSKSFIKIRMGGKMYSLWNRMEQLTDLKLSLMMSIYKDVIYLVIENLITKKDADSYRWARSLRTKIGSRLPKEPDFNNINALAQQLVQDMGVEKLLNSITKKG